MEGPQLEDQLAGLAYVKKLAYVDSNRLVVAGCSYGGIETLLAAERGAGLKAAMAMWYPFGEPHLVSAPAGLRR